MYPSPTPSPISVWFEHGGVWVKKWEPSQHYIWQRLNSFFLNINCLGLSEKAKVIQNIARIANAVPVTLYSLCHCLCHCPCLCYCIFVGQVMSQEQEQELAHHRIIGTLSDPWERHNVFVFVFVIVFVFVFVFLIFPFSGLVMSTHHSDQMLQRSQVTWVALFTSISKVPWVS